MIEPNFVDDVDCGSFFDHIDDLLDFPADDAATADASLPVAAASAGNIETPASFWSSESNSGLPATDTAFPRGDAVTDLSAEISVPYEDIVQLEWLSTFVEDSFSGRSLTMKKVEPPSTTTTTTTTKEDLTRSQFRTSSPVSVLESSSSCSREKVVAQCPEIYIPVVPCGRARSKRQRPASFKAHPVMQLISPASSVGENTQPNVILKASSDSENFAESHPAIKLAKQASGEHKKKKKTKAPNPLTEDDDNDTNQNSAAARKCMHCEITKTPQWRAGPMGPKTLCNACGVRYKSGRLFPEYRPAASPTFCPAVHSNSHKKVLEMRNKFGFSTDSAASPELIPNTSRLGLEYM